MTQYIDKSVLIAEIEKLKDKAIDSDDRIKWYLYNDIIKAINTLEVIDPYKQYIQYASIEAGIKAHAEDYSFNIESELFNQLTKEQQKLWRKEIEQACISGGYAGYQLARDPRYKENLEVKEVDLEKEYKEFVEKDPVYNQLVNGIVGKAIAKHFFKLGLAQKGE